MNITVKVSGPMFNGAPDRVLSKAIDQVIIAVAKVGVTEAKAELRTGHGVASGAFRRTITRSKRGHKATVYARNKMISKWLQGGSRLVKRRTRFQGYDIWGPAFRRTDRGAGVEARKITAELVRQFGGR